MFASKKADKFNTRDLEVNKISSSNEKDQFRIIDEKSFDSFLDIDEIKDFLYGDLRIIDNVKLFQHCSYKNKATDSDDQLSDLLEPSKEKGDKSCPVNCNQFEISPYNTVQFNDIPANNDKLGFKNCLHIGAFKNLDSSKGKENEEVSPVAGSKNSNLNLTPKPTNSKKTVKVDSKINEMNHTDKVLRNEIAERDKNSINEGKLKKQDKTVELNSNGLEINSLNKAFSSDEQIGFGGSYKLFNSKSNENFDLEGKIEFEKDISLIWPKVDQTPINKISRNYKSTNDNGTFMQNGDKEIKNFGMLSNISKDASNNTANAILTDEVSEKLSQTVNEHRKCNDMENKLDSLTHVSIDNTDHLKKRVPERQLPRDTGNSEQQQSLAYSDILAKHIDVFCANCKTKNFVGKIYKCLDCADFDLCGPCEAIIHHSHPMIRIIVHDNKDALNELSDIHQIKQNLTNRTEEQIKENFLRSITANKYANAVYKNLLRTHSHVKTEAFILEMTNIFG